MDSSKLSSTLATIRNLSLDMLKLSYDESNCLSHQNWHHLLHSGNPTLTKNLPSDFAHAANISADDLGRGIAVKFKQYSAFDRRDTRAHLAETREFYSGWVKIYSLN